MSAFGWGAFIGQLSDTSIFFLVMACRSDNVRAV